MHVDGSVREELNRTHLRGGLYGFLLTQQVRMMILQVAHKAQNRC
jgi:hypothetical protein